jgi:ADP-heptose:LPS heptosyltransferase
MFTLTRNIGGSYDPSKPDLNQNAPIHVLITRPNHRLGNLLLITPIIEDISATFPNAKIDLFVKGDISSCLFGDHPNINRIIKLPRKPFNELKSYLGTWLLLRKNSYDLVVNVDRGSSSGSLSTAFAKSRYKIFGEHLQHLPVLTEEQKHIAKNPVYEFRKFLASAGISVETTIPGLTLKLTEAELTAGKKIVEELISQPKRKTICLFTYATGEKCYAINWWSQFYKILKENFPDYNFLEVLPIENVSNLSFQIPHFYCKNVRELAAVIANTSIFIGADSGIMHLSSAVCTPTVGLFCITNEEKYGPYGHGSTAINTHKTSHQEAAKIIRDILESKISPDLSETRIDKVSAISK